MTQKVIQCALFFINRRYSSTSLRWSGFDLTICQLQPGFEDEGSTLAIPSRRCGDASAVSSRDRSVPATSRIEEKSDRGVKRQRFPGLPLSADTFRILHNFPRLISETNRLEDVFVQAVLQTTAAASGDDRSWHRRARFQPMNSTNKDRAANWNPTVVQSHNGSSRQSPVEKSDLQVSAPTPPDPLRVFSPTSLF